MNHYTAVAIRPIRCVQCLFTYEAIFDQQAVMRERILVKNMPELFVKFVVAVVRYREQSVIDAKRVQIVHAGPMAANFGRPVVQVLAVEQRHEAVTGIDLVLEQIRVASGAQLVHRQSAITFSGHAIECRINAENPRTFRPSPGQITYWHPPGGLGVRVDSGVYQGYRIPPYYDSLIGKLIVHGKTRNECLMRLRRALSEFVIDGIETTIPLFNDLILQPDIVNGLYDIHWLEKYLAKS